MLNCPACGSGNIRRSRRRGIIDNFRSWCGRWPYKCLGCKGRFTLPQQFKPRPPSARPMPYSGTQKPHAEVVISADSHEQLQAMLRTLGDALAVYDSAKRDVATPQ